MQSHGWTELHIERLGGVVEIKAAAEDYAPTPYVVATFCELSELTIPKLMTQAECRLFINEWHRRTVAADQDAIDALFAPVREAMAFGGFKDLWSYLMACARTWRHDDRQEG